MTEIIPTTHLTFQQIEDYLNSKISIENYNTKSKLTPFLSFEINCNGESFNYKTRSILDSLLINELVYIFKNDFKWQPAYQNNEPVDFVMYIYFDFKRKQIKILNKLDEMRRN